MKGAAMKSTSMERRQPMKLNLRRHTWSPMARTTAMHQPREDDVAIVTIVVVAAVARGTPRARRPLWSRWKRKVMR